MVLLLLFLAVAAIFIVPMVAGTWLIDSVFMRRGRSSRARSSDQAERIARDVLNERAGQEGDGASE